MTLVWTAPGDNCHGGQALKYDLRHALYPLTEQNFYSAIHDSTNKPHAAGLDDQATVGGLQLCTHYYFALKSQLDPNAWSAISNVADQFKPCGGFGPMAASSGVGAWIPENSVLNPATVEGSWTDRYRLGAPATGLETSYGVRLVESAPEATAIDSMALVAVDHSLGQEGVVRNGNTALATRQPA